jgi:hypothetical protein
MAHPDAPATRFPAHVATDRNPGSERRAFGGYDVRNDLKLRRLMMAMRDQACLPRHGSDDSLGDYDRVLDEIVERAFNTLRLDVSARGNASIMSAEQIRRTIGRRGGAVRQSSRSRHEQEAVSNLAAN